MNIFKFFKKQVEEKQELPIKIAEWQETHAEFKPISDDGGSSQLACDQSNATISICNDTISSCDSSFSSFD